MKNYIRIFSYIAAFVFGALMFHNKPNNNLPSIVIKKDTVIRYDSVYVPKIVYKYNDIYHTDTAFLPSSTDTVAILSDYIKKRFYADTLRNDTNVYISVYDTVQYNRITSRRKEIRIYPHTKIITLHEKPTWHIYLGAGIGGGQNSFGFTPSILYQGKNQRIFGIDYDVLRKEVFVSAYLRIK